VNTIRPPASLKYTAKTADGDLKFPTSAPFEPKTVTDKLETAGKITKIGYDEIVMSSCCASTSDTEFRLFPLISTEIETGVQLNRRDICPVSWTQIIRAGDADFVLFSCSTTNPRFPFMMLSAGREEGPERNQICPTVGRCSTSWAKRSICSWINGHCESFCVRSD
jgi:hypothetical protein